MTAFTLIQQFLLDYLAVFIICGVIVVGLIVANIILAINAKKQKTSAKNKKPEQADEPPKVGL